MSNPEDNDNAFATADEVMRRARSQTPIPRRAIASSVDSDSDQERREAREATAEAKEKEELDRRGRFLKRPTKTEEALAKAEEKKRARRASRAKPTAEEDNEEEAEVREPGAPKKGGKAPRKPVKTHTAPGGRKKGVAVPGKKTKGADDMVHVDVGTPGWLFEPENDREQRENGTPSAQETNIDRNSTVEDAPETSSPAEQVEDPMTVEEPVTREAVNVDLLPNYEDSSDDDRSDGPWLPGMRPKANGNGRQVSNAAPVEERGSDARVPPIEVTPAIPMPTEQEEDQEDSDHAGSDLDKLAQDTIHTLAQCELFRRGGDTIRAATPIGGADGHSAPATAGPFILVDKRIGELAARLPQVSDPALDPESPNGTTLPDEPVDTSSPIESTKIICIEKTTPYHPNPTGNDIDFRAHDMLIHIVELASNPREWLDFLGSDDYEISRGMNTAIEAGHPTAYSVLTFVFGKMNDNSGRYNQLRFDYENIKLVLQALGDNTTARTPAAIWSPYSMLVELCRKLLRRESHTGAKEYKDLWTAIVENASYILLALDERRFPLRTPPADFSYVLLLVMTLTCERQLRVAQTLVNHDEHFDMYQHRVFSLLERLRKDKYPHEKATEVIHIWTHLQNQIQEAYKKLAKADEVENAAPEMPTSIRGAEISASGRTEEVQAVRRCGKRRLPEQGGREEQQPTRGPTHKETWMGERLRGWEGYSK